MGRTTGNNVWYYSDFDMADQILACANQQGLIDPQRIYSAGCSAGGIHTSTMAYARSGYLAASTPNSGGIIFTTPLQDAAHVPFQMSSHGAREKDLVRSGQAATGGALAPRLRADCEIDLITVRATQAGAFPVDQQVTDLTAGI